MNKLIQKLKCKNNWQSQFQDFNLKNNLINNPLSRLQDQNIEALIKHLSKIFEQKQTKHSISWVSTEYQILEIVLNALSVITQKIIEDFTLREWESVYHIFHYKQPLTIKYESIRVIQQKKQPRRRWCASEENFLIEIVKKSLRKNKWNDIARQLFIKSDGRFFRQGKHCRERWLNHLHPSIQNNSWSRDEDIKLLQFVLKKGKKWARIAKKFGMTRSEWMVKKRLYELINIEEQNVPSSESLKNGVKIALKYLKSELGLREATIKSNDQSQQESDNNQRESSSSGEKPKIKIQERPFEQEIIAQVHKKLDVNRAKELSQELLLSSYTGINGAQNYLIPQISMEGRMNEGFRGYMWYDNYLGNPVHPLYSYYSQFMAQIPSSMFRNQQNVSKGYF